MTVNEELFEAVADNNVNKVKLLVKEVANLDLFNKLGITPLLLACRKGYTDIVEILIKAGANVNIKAQNDIYINKGGATALMIACYEGNIKIVKMLLEAGADVNATNLYGSTTLEHATINGNVEIVEMLIAAKADVNITDDRYHDSFLMDALFSKSLEIFNILIKAGAKIDYVNKEGNSPLMVASSRIRYDEDKLRSNDTIQMFLDAGANLNITNKEGNSALMLSLQLGHKDLLNVAELLIKAGADVNIVNYKGESALTLAIEGSHRLNPANSVETPSYDPNIGEEINDEKYALSSSLYNEYIEVIELLLSHRCNIALSEKLLMIVNSDDLLKELITSNQADTLLEKDVTKSIISTEVSDFGSEDSFVEAKGTTNESD